MGAQLPKSIEDLAEKNLDLMSRIGFSTGDDPEELRTPESYQATGLFTQEMINKMFFEDPSTTVTAAAERTIDDKTLVLIRPDMFHARNDFMRFLSERFRIIADTEFVMDTETYWQIYRYDHYTRESMHCRLTRAAISIGSMCHLVIVEGNDTSDVNFADFFFSRYKGKQGVFQSNTLRGDIVYRNATALGVHQFDPDGGGETLWHAADPFNAYRSSALTNPDSHHLRYPLLFYTGVGVHVPNGAEVESDIQALARLTGISLD